MDKKLIVLDLDETLIYAKEEELSIPYDFKTSLYFVYKRPYMKEFLNFCLENFKVAVWTSSGEDYAQAIVRKLFSKNYPLEFVWARQRCIQSFDPESLDYLWVKDLKKVKRRGYKLEQVIMIDDTPAKLRRNYGNLVRVSPFEGSQVDKELLFLMDYLKLLLKEENIRAVEKRNWKAKFYSL